MFQMKTTFCTQRFKKEEVRVWKAKLVTENLENEIINNKEILFRAAFY